MRHARPRHHSLDNVWACPGGVHRVVDASGGSCAKCAVDFSTQYHLLSKVARRMSVLGACAVSYHNAVHVLLASSVSYGLYSRTHPFGHWDVYCDRELEDCDRGTCLTYLTNLNSIEKLCTVQSRTCQTFLDMLEWEGLMKKALLIVLDNGDSFSRCILVCFRLLFYYWRGLNEFFKVWYAVFLHSNISQQRTAIHGIPEGPDFLLNEHLRKVEKMQYECLK